MSEPKKGSWFGGLKSLIVEEVPENGTTPAAPSGQPTVTPASTLPMVASIPTPAPVAVVDPSVQKKLEEGLAAEAPPGYAEIINNLTALAEDVTEERARYRAAIRMAAKNGHSQVALLGDMDRCIGILEAKNTEFADEVKRQIETKVGARRASIANREAEITAKTELMARLQQEIGQLQQDNLTESEQISSETSKITSIGNNFRFAYQAVLSNIQTIRNKISTYGEGVK
jgi:hypothetical protein